VIESSAMSGTIPLWLELD